jgi:hypothetical protein
MESKSSILISVCHPFNFPFLANVMFHGTGVHIHFVIVGGILYLVDMKMVLRNLFV